jgi:hypothetical protein
MIANLARRSVAERPSQVRSLFETYRLEAAADLGLEEPELAVAGLYGCFRRASLLCKERKSARCESDKGSKEVRKSRF